MTTRITVPMCPICQHPIALAYMRQTRPTQTTAALMHAAGGHHHYVTAEGHHIYVYIAQPPVAPAQMALL